VPIALRCESDCSRDAGLGTKAAPCIGVNLSGHPPSLPAYPIVRQGMNSLSNSESPLKRTNEFNNSAFLNWGMKFVGAIPPWLPHR